MAAPVDSQRLASFNTGGATSLTVNVGSPAAGDILIVSVRWAGAISAPVFTGYSTLKSLVSDASGDDASVYWKVADGTEGTTDSLTWTTSLKCCAMTWVVTGADTSATPDISADATGTTGANVANPNSVSVTGGPKDVLYIALFSGDGEGSGTGFGPSVTGAPTNYVNLTKTDTSTSGAVGTNCGVSGASRQITSSSSDDPGVFTHTTVNSGWTAWTVAIPAAAAAAFVPIHSVGASKTYVGDPRLGHKQGAVGRGSVW